jgi:hypothetical protein
LGPSGKRLLQMAREGKFPRCLQVKPEGSPPSIAIVGKLLQLIQEDRLMDHGVDDEGLEDEVMPAPNGLPRNSACLNYRGRGRNRVGAFS